MHLESRPEHGILIVAIANPPVNCLSLGIRHDLNQLFMLSANDPKVSGIVLCGSGKYFCAGGDLREMGTASAVDLNWGWRVIARWRSPRSVYS